MAHEIRQIIAAGGLRIVMRAEIVNVREGAAFTVCQSRYAVRARPEIDASGDEVGSREVPSY